MKWHKITEYEPEIDDWIFFLSMKGDQTSLLFDIGRYDSFITLPNGDKGGSASVRVSKFQPEEFTLAKFKYWYPMGKYLFVMSSNRYSTEWTLGVELMSSYYHRTGGVGIVGNFVLDKYPLLY